MKLSNFVMVAARRICSVEKCQKSLETANIGTMNLVYKMSTYTLSFCLRQDDDWIFSPKKDFIQKYHKDLKDISTKPRKL